MKHLLTILLTTLTITTALAQNYQWAHGFGGTSYDAQGNSIATDAQGNVYVTGTFGDSIDFDPGPDTANVGSSLWNTTHMFLAKYDSSGGFEWALNADGWMGQSEGVSLAVNDSGVFVTGTFEGLVDFDPLTNSTTDTISSDNDQNIFVAHYDLNGNFKRVTNINAWTSNAITLDDFGNCYITGHFFSIVDFDGSNAVANLTASGSGDAFIAKYNSSGNYQWAFNFGCNKTNTPVLEEGYSLAIDPAGILVTGKFADTTDFDPSANIYNLEATSGKWVFVAKYNLNGNLIWAGNIGGNSGEVAYSIASDPSGNGNFCITGSASDTVDFDLTNADYVVNCGAGRFYFAKYDNNANLVFVKIAGSGGASGRNLKLDIHGNIFIVGLFVGTTDFDPDIGVANLTATGSGSSPDIFLAKYDSNGNYIWAKSMGGAYSDWGKCIALDTNGNQYITGFFSNTADFDPDTAIVNLIGIGGNQAIFIAKYADTSTGTADFYLQPEEIIIYPNPALNLISIKYSKESSQVITVIIYDITGKVCFKNSFIENIKINISSLNPGIYTLQVKNNKQNLYSKFIKQ